VFRREPVRPGRRRGVCRDLGCRWALAHQHWAVVTLAPWWPPGTKQPELKRSVGTSKNANRKGRTERRESTSKLGKTGSRPVVFSYLYSTGADWFWQDF